MQIDYDDTNPDSDRNAHSNQLCRWIDLILFQLEFNVHYFRRVDGPLM